MRVLIGSHAPLMRAWEDALTPQQKAMLPRVHGLVPEPKEGAAAYPERLPPGRFPPLFLRFSKGKCRNCPFFRALLVY